MVKRNSPLLQNAAEAKCRDEVECLRQLTRGTSHPQLGNKRSHIESERVLAKRKFISALRMWRQGEKAKQVALLKPKNVALHRGMCRLLAAVFIACGPTLLKRIVLYVGRRWPVKPIPCWICGVAKSWKHYECHCEELGTLSYSEVDAMLGDAAKHAHRVKQMSELTLSVRATIEDVSDTLDKYMSLWRYY
jgi:hypothetical protein